MSSISSFVMSNPTVALIPALASLSYLSLSLTPSFISLVFLLTSLLLYTRGSFDQRQTIRKISLSWLTLTASISLSHFLPSIHALSTPSISIFSLALLSGLSAAIALIPICASHYIRFRHFQQFVVFPSLWATTWLIISWMSPIGRLITWTPLAGMGSYRWITPFLGFAGLDWITAAWASVAAETLGTFGPLRQKEDTLIDIHGVTEQAPLDAAIKKRFALLTGFLLALTVPSFFKNYLPMPPISSSTTPLPLACILPETSNTKSQLERFLDETNRYGNSAKILLWPESAVTFGTESEKVQALEKVQSITERYKTWVGVSYEESISGSGLGSRDGLRRNGMTLVGPRGVEWTYYKRRLVPIAESFSKVGSNIAPQVHTIDIPRPKNAPKSEWGPSETRAISLSASICLDFSSPLTSLDSRPALILAPANTWHIGVGSAMYELARARGEEIGADVLWCDGGAGGLSGVAGNVQVGAGSWVKAVGMPHPFSEKRTIYGAGGDWFALAAILGLPAMIYGITQQAQTGQSMVTWIRRRTSKLVSRLRFRRANSVEAEPLLR